MYPVPQSPAEYPSPYSRNYSLAEYRFNSLINTFFPQSLEGRKEAWAEERAKAANEFHHTLQGQWGQFNLEKEFHKRRLDETHQWVEELIQKIENKEVADEPDSIRQEEKRLSIDRERTQRNEMRLEREVGNQVKVITHEPTPNTSGIEKVKERRLTTEIKEKLSQQAADLVSTEPKSLPSDLSPAVTPGTSYFELFVSVLMHPLLVASATSSPVEARPQQETEVMDEEKRKQLERAKLKEEGRKKFEEKRRRMKMEQGGSLTSIEKPAADLPKRASELELERLRKEETERVKERERLQREAEDKEFKATTTGSLLEFCEKKFPRKPQGGGVDQRQFVRALPFTVPPRQALTTFDSWRTSLWYDFYFPLLLFYPLCPHL